MAYHSGPQGASGPGGQTPPEGYGPPPNLGAGSVGPPQRPSGPGSNPGRDDQSNSQPYVPLQSRPPLGAQFGAHPVMQEQPRDKGFIVSLFDLNFDYMVTARLIRLVYVIALGLITLLSVIVAWYGIGFLRWNGLLGIMVLGAAPCLWLFWTLVTRMFMEFLINQFKISEYLRTIKDKL